MDKQALPEIIETPRIRLLRYHEDQADALFAAIDASRERLGAFLPWVEQTRNADDERGALRGMAREWDARTGFGWTITAVDGGEVLGGMGVHNIVWGHDRCEIGYWVAAAAEGRGIISEALQALERALFDTGFHRLEIRCRPENTRSASVAERNGYILEGRFREGVCEGNAYHDTLVYAKIVSA